jgi:hypothetical protein
MKTPHTKMRINEITRRKLAGTIFMEALDLSQPSRKKLLIFAVNVGIVLANSLFANENNKFGHCCSKWPPIAWKNTPL